LLHTSLQLEGHKWDLDAMRVDFWNAATYYLCSHCISVMPHPRKTQTLNYETHRLLIFAATSNTNFILPSLKERVLL
jgi:hypothetical protein